MTVRESPSRQVRRGVLKLLEIKDSDIRILTLEQCRDAADKGLHAGGAFSATIPLVALFYGGFLDIDVADPTRRGQDMFTLSKGHAVAALASIYAEVGYFDRAVLKGSRSYDSILNGHPGPVLPGIQIATGPMGQGLSVAQGFAIAGKMNPRFDSYAVTGDGELQEGTIWEGVMFAGQKHLDNLCVLIDQNNGQLDMANRMIFPTPRLEAVFESFDWRVFSVDATSYDGVFAALEEFRFGNRNGKPTAIVCHSTKGFGACSDFMNRHKVTVADDLMAQELAMQARRRERRVADFVRYRADAGEGVRARLDEVAAGMHLDAGGGYAQSVGPVRTKRAAAREKRICYDAAALPKIDRAKEYAASDIVTAAMKVFARDERVVSIDADLATTSGLEAGVAAVDQARALNVGVAEANMMNIGEAFAALGCNTWVSTFCPFFNWQVLRRVAVGHQERLESIAARNSWLSEGHGLDLTFLATGPDFETRTNGATHMGNDDITIFDGAGHLKIVNISCPRQLLGAMRWVMAGNRGLVYLRVMRAPSKVLYGDDFVFEFGKSWALRESADDAAVIVTSGRGVHEALEAARMAQETFGIAVGVVDMPSVDAERLESLRASGKLIVFAEQNNGFLWQNYLRAGRGAGRALMVNTLGADGRPQYIHSGTYEQLLDAFGLSPALLARRIQEAL
ncbi:MAG: transketolase [Acidobacteriota bacterium]|nr:transketolase [Acidobacteriota bacterium]